MNNLNFGFTHSPEDDIEQIRDNLRDHYDNGFPIIKELLQNADDARASRMDFGVTVGLEGVRHPLLKAPALFVVNDGPFKDTDYDGIRKLGRSGKGKESSTIGRFGLGMKSIFHLCEAFFKFNAGIV